jgi:hypothetical protein
MVARPPGTLCGQRSVADGTKVQRLEQGVPRIRLLALTPSSDISRCAKYIANEVEGQAFVTAVVISEPARDSSSTVVDGFVREFGAMAHICDGVDQ